MGMLNTCDKAVGVISHYESPENPQQHISIGFSSQVAWIQNATIKDNILFGKKYDQNFYNLVINACALTDDLKIMRNGDETEIGEKGITLSGGQKQRLSIARAVYSNADVYIFDDPLSAVDGNVANHIYNECFIKLLKNNNKTVILSTHSIKFLKDADNIIVMNNSEIQIQGVLKDLQKAKIDLTQFVLNKEMQRKSSQESERKKGVVCKRRRSSLTSLSQELSSVSIVEIEQHKGGLIQEEIREIGAVTGQIYMKYIKAMQSFTLVIFVIIIAFLFSAVQIIVQIWVTKWSSESDADNNWYYLRVWCLLIVAVLGFQFSQNILLLTVAFKASKNLHNRLLEALTHAKVSFFTETPIGRIIHRFGEDMTSIDILIPVTLSSFVGIVCMAFIMLLVTIIATPWFAVIIIPVGIVYNYIQLYFIASTRSLRRLQPILSAPIYSNFSETLAGLDIIRVLNKSDQFSVKNRTLINKYLNCQYTFMTAHRWLTVRISVISSIMTAFAALLCAITLPPPQIVGLAVTSIVGINFVAQAMVVIKAELENQLVSVERVDQYTNIERERTYAYGHGDSENENENENEWPTNGDIYFNNVWMKYRNNLDFVLRGLTFKISGGEKVGIIGRTGAGKSTLFVTLLRLVEFDCYSAAKNGCIQIDGINISQIGLHDLRKKISVIPQDPILFNGTIKYNLDPFDETSAESLINSLKSVNMWHELQKMCSEKNNPLQFKVQENGNNFSLGQRQLLCLARAIVRNCKIILLDEATSSVDHKTDKLIQQTIRSIFTNNTILTIAHRIETIMDYDKILIMDNGNILEYDSPKNLLKDKQSKFSQICNHSLVEWI